MRGPRQVALAASNLQQATCSKQVGTKPTATNQATIAALPNPKTEKEWRHVLVMHAQRGCSRVLCSNLGLLQDVIIRVPAAQHSTAQHSTAQMSALSRKRRIPDVPPQPQHSTAYHTTAHHTDCQPDVSHCLSSYVCNACNALSLKPSTQFRGVVLPYCPPAAKQYTHCAPMMTAISSTASTGSSEARVTMPKPSRVLPAGQGQSRGQDRTGQDRTARGRAQHVQHMTAEPAEHRVPTCAEAHESE
jgi:hypothetical protein